MAEIAISPPERLFARLRSQHRFRECFHADNTCSKGIIRAHSISRSRVLGSIAVNGEVLMFGLSNTPGQLQEQLVGKKQSTTFTNFCGKHDQLFLPIDENPYVPGDRRAEFLFAYRSSAREYAALYSSVRTQEWLLAERLRQARGKAPTEGVQVNTHPQDIQNSGQFMRDQREMLGYLDQRRRAFNVNMDNQRYDRVSTVTLTFEGLYPIAVASSFQFEMDPYGNVINDLSEPPTDATVRMSYLTVIPQDDQTFVLISFDSRNRSRFRWLEQVTNEPVEQQKVIVSNIIGGYTENFALSPAYWEQLNSTQRDTFVDLLRDMGSWSHERLIHKPDLNLFSVPLRAELS